MGGDGMGGMALLIGAVMIALPIAGAVSFLVAGRAASRRAGAATARLVMGGSALIGGLVGAAASLALFRPTLWRPLPEIRLVYAPGGVRDCVILLESPGRGRPIAWTGREGPFTGLHAVVTVPPGGVVRVRALDRLREGARVVWPDGGGASGRQQGPAPAGIDATAFAAWTRGGGDGCADIPLDEDAARAWFRHREAAGADGGPVP